MIPIFISFMFRRAFHTGRPSVLRGPVRLLAVFLVAAQFGVVPALALGDPPPTPSYHADHLGAEGNAGCQPFHDELTCLACRLLSTLPMGSGSAPALPVLSVERHGIGLDVVHQIPGGAHLTGLRARAPPHA
ncbi:MAG: hypothetical protein R6U63_07165 [Longimicrobiales bacterium]